jgi:hypothetical protein
MSVNEYDLVVVGAGKGTNVLRITCAHGLCETRTDPNHVD